MHAGDECVVIGWQLGTGERRVFAGAAILDPSGLPRAVARQTLVFTERGFPLSLDGW